MIWPEVHEVIISRQLQPYTLRVEVWPGGQDVEVGMQLHDFVASAVKEMGNPSLIVTQEQLRKKFLEACDVVCEKMKSGVLEAMTTVRRK